MGLAVGGFEREGDKVYLAREVLQGRYGKAADIFRCVWHCPPWAANLWLPMRCADTCGSFGMVMLETATNIVVPDQ